MVFTQNDGLGMDVVLVLVTTCSFNIFRLTIKFIILYCRNVNLNVISNITCFSFFGKAFIKKCFYITHFSFCGNSVKHLEELIVNVLVLEPIFFKHLLHFIYS